MDVHGRRGGASERNVIRQSDERTGTRSGMMSFFAVSDGLLGFLYPPLKDRPYGLYDRRDSLKKVSANKVESRPCRTKLGRPKELEDIIAELRNEMKTGAI